jgi:hypothetical protein
LSITEIPVGPKSPATTITTTGFGAISTAYPPRNIQLGMMLTF